MSAYVVKCRGGFADGAFLVATGRVPEEVMVFEWGGDRSGLYVYEGGEEQYRSGTKTVEAVFHIFRPASGCDAR